MTDFYEFMNKVSEVGMKDDPEGIIPGILTKELYFGSTLEHFTKSWEWSRGFITACYLADKTSQETYDLMKNFATTLENRNNEKSEN